MKLEDIKLLNLYRGSLKKWERLVDSFEERMALGSSVTMFIDEYVNSPCAFCREYRSEELGCSECTINRAICDSNGRGGLYKRGRWLESRLACGWWLVLMCFGLKREIKKLEESK